MSRAVIQESFGGPEVLQVRDVKEPHAGPGEVRVRVSAAGLNPVARLTVARPGLTVTPPRLTCPYSDNLDREN